MAITKEDKDLVTDLQEKFNASLDHPAWRNFASNGRTDFEYKEGKQWTNAEKAEVEGRGQAATVENEIKPIIDRLVGQYKNQKTRIIFRGRNLTDEEEVNTLSDLVLHACQSNGYEFEEGDMFEDTNTCGFGILETYMEFDEALQPEIKIRHEDCFNIFPDPNSKRYDWNEDAEYICRAKWMSVEKAKKKWPAKAKELDNLINSNPVVNDTQELQQNNYVDWRLKRIRPVEIWYKTYRLRRIALLTTPTDITKLSKKKEKDLLVAFPDTEILEKVDVVMKMAIFCVDIILTPERDTPHDHNLFPFVPYFIHRKKDGEPYSMVRMLKDPNMEINKRRSKALHLLNTNQVEVEEGAIRDKDAYKKEAARPDGILEFRKGYKWVIQKNIELAQSQMALQAESKQAMMRISGVSDESMARHSEIRSGIGLQRKQAMTDIIITPIFENLRRTRMILGKILYELIKQYYTEEKIFYVTDDLKKARQVKLTQKGILAIKEGIYDIIIEEMPDTTTIMDEQFRIIGDTLKSMNVPPNYAMVLLPLMIQLSQIRGKEAVLKQIEQLSQPPPEHPKISLNLVWSELQAFEKATFAQLMGYQEMAQMELQAGGLPASTLKEQAGIQKISIKADTDIKKELIKAGSKANERNKTETRKD